MCKRLSIGIVAYNEEVFLPNLLDNMKAQKYPHELIEIVLIDSCSTDGTKAVMEKSEKFIKEGIIDGVGEMDTSLPAKIYHRIDDFIKS